MLARILEVEAMDSLAEAVDYDAMDHRGVNRQFVDDFLDLLAEPSPAETPAPPARRQVLDLGTGTAQIPIELCRRGDGFAITAVDMSHAMLQIAQKNVLCAGLTAAINLDQVDAKALPYAAGMFDAVISNSLIHHIPKPLAILREVVRVVRPGGRVFLRDLLRPDDEQTVAHLVETYAADANAHQRQMFADSLHAALTLAEIRELLAEAGLPPRWAVPSSDRHWTAAGRIAAT